MYFDDFKEDCHARKLARNDDHSYIKLSYKHPPTGQKMSLDDAKKNACLKALPFIKNDMIVGLGTGSTAEIFLRLLADYIKDYDIHIKGVPTSQRTREVAQNLGIPLLNPHEATRCDICVDGTDEFDSSLRLIKGGGGALLCEKIIARSADKMIVITDESKFVRDLGKFPLPVEVNNFELGMIFAELSRTFAKHTNGKYYKPMPRMKQDNTVFITDMGHIIVDMPLNIIQNPKDLSDDLLNISGVVEHGLFLAEATVILTNERELYHI